MSPVSVDLTGVPETMLWTLHNRAGEAMRSDAVLRDPDAIRIYAAIDYDFEGHFGKAEGSHAVRARQLDLMLSRWLEQHPDGFVVSLGEGLETQALRVDNGRMRWLSVDVPSAIAVRSRFLPATDRFHHLAASALDPAWMDAVEPSKGVFVIAQGLFMYFHPDEVRRLLGLIAHRLSGAEIVFDTIPRWFSSLTVRGLNRTPQYRVPPMPWGINRDQIAPLVTAWAPSIKFIDLQRFAMPRGLPRVVEMILGAFPWFRMKLPSLVHCGV